MAGDLPASACGDAAAGDGSRILRFRPPSRIRPAWSREAKMVLPSSGHRLHASAIWGPVLAYVVSSRAWRNRLGAKIPRPRRWRSSIGSGCANLSPAPFRGGDISEDGWRAAARVRLAFLFQTLTSAKPTKAARGAFAGFPRELWEDGDARWLLKVHESQRESGTSTRSCTSRSCGGRNCPICSRLAAPVRGGKDEPAASLGDRKDDRAKIEDACEQAEEAGFRLGKKKEPVRRPPKREKSALAK